MFGRLYPTDNGHTRLQLLETFSIKTTSKDTRLSLVNHVFKPNNLESSLEHLHHNPFIPDEMHLPVKDEIFLTVKTWYFNDFEGNNIFACKVSQLTFSLWDIYYKVVIVVIVFVNVYKYLSSMTSVLIDLTAPSRSSPWVVRPAQLWPDLLTSLDNVTISSTVSHTAFYPQTPSFYHQHHSHIYLYKAHCPFVRLCLTQNNN